MGPYILWCVRYISHRNKELVFGNVVAQGQEVKKIPHHFIPLFIPTVWNRVVGKSATAAHRQRLNALMAPPCARFIQFAGMRDGARRCARMTWPLPKLPPLPTRSPTTPSTRPCAHVKAARVSKKAFEARRAALKRAVEEVAISSKAQLLLEQLQSMLQSPAVSPQISRI